MGAVCQTIKHKHFGKLMTEKSQKLPKIVTEAFWNYYNSNGKKNRDLKKGKLLSVI